MVISLHGLRWIQHTPLQHMRRATQGPHVSMYKRTRALTLCRFVGGVNTLFWVLRQQRCTQPGGEGESCCGS